MEKHIPASKADNLLLQSKHAPKKEIDNVSDTRLVTKDARRFPLLIDKNARAITRIFGFIFIIVGAFFTYFNLENEKFTFSTGNSNFHYATLHEGLYERTLSQKSEFINSVFLDDKETLRVNIDDATNVFFYGLSETAQSYFTIGQAVKKTATEWEYVWDTTELPDGIYQLYALGVKANDTITVVDQSKRNLSRVHQSDRGDIENEKILHRPTSTKPTSAEKKIENRPNALIGASSTEKERGPERFLEIKTISSQATSSLFLRKTGEMKFFFVQDISPRLTSSSSVLIDTKQYSEGEYTLTVLDSRDARMHESEMLHFVLPQKTDARVLEYASTSPSIERMVLLDKAVYVLEGNGVPYSHVSLTILDKTFSAQVDETGSFMAFVPMRLFTDEVTFVTLYTDTSTLAKSPHIEEIIVENNVARLKKSQNDRERLLCITNGQQYDEKKQLCQPIDNVNTMRLMLAVLSLTVVSLGLTLLLVGLYSLRKLERERATKRRK